MKKIKLTKEQYDRLSPILKEEINENVFSPELHQAIHEFIQNLWMNPSQKGLSTFFVENGITWGDIMSYLSAVGIVGAATGGIYKVKNYFQTLFSKDKNQAQKQKVQDIERMVKKVEADPKAPWNTKPIGYAEKQLAQAKPESGYKKQPTGFNSNRFKPASAGATTNDTRPFETDEGVDIGDGSNYPPGTENDPNAPWNQKEPVRVRSKLTGPFKPVYMGKELAILNAPDGMYIFDYSVYDESDFPNYEDGIEKEDIADFVNEHLSEIPKGIGVKAFEYNGAHLAKLDPKLKEFVSKRYEKDKKLIELLNKLDETTGAASSGAFVGPLGGGNPNKNISPDYSPAEQIDETTTAAGTPQSSGTGQYVQPAIWANGKENWKANKKTQYAGGSFVELDSCTKLNNNLI